MCTLIAIHRCVPGSPLVVAANRDEYLDRPAEGPAIRTLGRGRAAIAPLDVRAGGTWLGVNTAGVFAALTNIRSSDPDPGRSSRGMVVLEALRADHAEAAITVLGELGQGTYNSFNCYVADARSAFCLVYRDAPKVLELEPGVHVVGNTPADEAGNAKVERIREQAQRAADGPRERLLEELAGVCREHGAAPEPLSDTCVHVADTYGTRSSILLDWAERDERSRFLHSEGPPCQEPYQDLTALLSELRQTPGYESTEILARKAI